MVGIAVSIDVGVKVVVANSEALILSDLALPIFGRIARASHSLVLCLWGPNKLSGAL